MPHVVFIPLTGLRVRSDEMLELGMTLPGLQQRGAAIARLPALGLLTLAGLLPENWTCSYQPVDHVTDDVIDAVVAELPRWLPCRHSRHQLRRLTGSAIAFANTAFVL